MSFQKLCKHNFTSPALHILRAHYLFKCIICALYQEIRFEGTDELTGRILNEHDDGIEIG